MGKTPPESPGERFAKNYLPSGSKDERERAARRFDAFATTIGAIVVIVAAFAKPLARLYNQWFSRESLSTAIAVVVAVAVIGLLVWLFGFLFRKGWNAAERKQ